MMVILINAYNWFGDNVKIHTKQFMPLSGKIKRV